MKRPLGLGRVRHDPVGNAAASQMTKRGRGRPRKVKPPPELSAFQKALQKAGLDPVSRDRDIRPRGRPATRLENAVKATRRFRSLTRAGKSAREARQQIAQELGRRTPRAEEYIRQQVAWYYRTEAGLDAELRIDWIDEPFDPQTEDAHDVAARTLAPSL